MKPYPNTNVEMSYQNCGTQWLLILVGNETDIESVFNGLFNLKATNGELKWTDHTRTIATFWSNPKKMREFFYNQHCLACGLPLKNCKQANVVSEMQIAKLTEESTQFFDFNRQFVPETYNMGQASAENPDGDFRDAVLDFALKDKTSVKQVEQLLATK